METTIIGYHASRTPWQALGYVPSAVRACMDDAAKEIERLRGAIECALRCTPHILYSLDFDETGDASIVYDCGDPWEILRNALRESDNG